MYKIGLITILSAFLLPSSSPAGWTPPVRISDEEYSFGPRIAAKGDTLHVVYWRGGVFTSSYYVRSDDGGSTWGEPFHLPDTTYTSNNVMPIILFEDDKIAVIWRGDIRGGGTELNYGYRLSTDGGLTWDDIEYVLADDQDMVQKHAFCISNSKLFFIYSYWDQEIIVEFTKSSDWGETWTDPTEIFRTYETGRFDMVARADTVHFAWIGRFDDSQRWETYYIKSEDSGETWSDNMALSTLDDKGSLWPSISVDDEGKLVTCWMDFKYSPYFLTGDIFVRYSHDSGDNWTEDDQLTSHHRVHATRILWEGDSIHVVWEDWRGGQTDIYYMHSTDNGLTWEDEQRVEDDPGQSLNPHLAVVDETVYVVWRQDSGLDGRGIYYSRRDDENPQIPTLTEWGVLILALLLLAAGTIAIVQTKRTTLTVERR